MKTLTHILFLVSVFLLVGACVVLPTPTPTPLQTTKLVSLQIPGVTTTLQMPSDLSVIAEVHYIERKPGADCDVLTFEVTQGDQIQRVGAGKILNGQAELVCKGYMKVPQEWVVEYTFPLEMNQPAWFSSDQGTKAKITFVRTTPEGYADVLLEYIRVGTTQVVTHTANLCAQKCGSSFGMGNEALNGLDVENDQGKVSAHFFPGWDVVEPWQAP